MTERKELQLKNSIALFLRQNFVLEGAPHLVEDRILELTVGLFDLVENVLGYPQAKEEE